EPVSDPSIQILDRALANGSCTITLNCTAGRGDNISYSWSSQDMGTPEPLCSHNGSLLHLSYPLRNVSIACACTASNAVSSRVVTFNSSECGYEQGGNAGLRTGHIVLLVVVPVVTVMLLTRVFVAPHLPTATATPEPEHPPLAEDSAVHTIYSQVQRVEKPKAALVAEHPSCTTIYAAATGLPPDTSPAPNKAPRLPCSPSTEPFPRQGHPSLSQSPDKEPTTVYASVMMPTA
ncbi:SLAF1 protein, partial [Chionis minor]|nr:SLAF1 protein [Chionis minor]